MQDPVDHTLSAESIEKLKASEKKGREEGKYKTKYDFCKVECYDIYGNHVITYNNKEEAAKQLNVRVQNIMRAASGYKKGLILRPYGYHVRYSDSKVPVQKFEPNLQYIGAYYNFYYIDENGNEQKAFDNLRDA